MLNHIVIMGRMARTPELKQTETGVSVASFTLAVERDMPSANGQKEVDFIDCVAWRKTGEFAAKYFQKGSMAVAKGRLQIRPWTDKNGNKRRNAEVLVDNLYFGESKRKEESSSLSGYAASGYPEAEAAIARYSQGFIQPGSDYPQLTDDDKGLPF